MGLPLRLIPLRQLHDKVNLALALTNHLSQLKMGRLPRLRAALLQMTALITPLSYSLQPHFLTTINSSPAFLLYYHALAFVEK